MKLLSLTRPFLGSLLFLCAGAVFLSAQQTPETGAPKPAARSLPPIIGAQDETAQTPEGTLLPDTTPLTGILAPTLGTPALEHSFVVFGAGVGSTIESEGSENSGWYANNYFTGNLSLVKNWRRGLTSINYSGGGYVSSNGSHGNSNYQNFSFFQNYHYARWDLSLVDSFAYLPQSQFGFGGGTNLGTAGAGSPLGVPAPGIEGGPTQDIFGTHGPRYMNSVAAQANYTLSARDSLTFSGSYGILRFTEAGNVDSDTITASVGYNREVTKADTIGVSYTFSPFHYSGSPQAYGSHSLGISYGRKITGRLALQISGGPQINTYRIPVNGKTSAVSGYGSASLAYALENGSVGMTYHHGLSNGSGALIGSQLDQVTGSISRRLGRVWTGFANFGFSRNTPVESGAGFDNQSYDDWFLGAGLSRPFGRSVQFAAAYTANFEKVQKSGCTTGSCTTDFTQHMITLSLQWHSRPFVLH